MTNLHPNIKSLQKVPYEPGPNSGYKRPELTPKFVFDHAHLVTQEQLAKIFSISRPTLMGDKALADAWHAGREYHPLMRKRALERFLDQVQPDPTPSDVWGEEGYNHRHKDAKSNEFLKATELWARWFSDLNRKDAEVEASPHVAMTAEELDAAILAVAKEKGWTPPNTTKE